MKVMKRPVTEITEKTSHFEKMTVLCRTRTAQTSQNSAFGKKDAGVARSTFGSTKCQKRSRLDDFWKLRY